MTRKVKPTRAQKQKENPNKKYDSKYAQKVLRRRKTSGRLGMRDTPYPVLLNEEEVSHV